MCLQISEVDETGALFCLLFSLFGYITAFILSVIVVHMILFCSNWNEIEIFLRKLDKA